MKNLTLFLPVSLMLAACTPQPAPEAFYNYGDPEGLIDLSTEVVNVGLAKPSDLQELTQWINDDPPSRVELGCSGQTIICKRAIEILKQFEVSYSTDAATDGTASLVYERIQARDCDNRYVNNTSNQYNENHSSFGCSAKVNMVQSITDRRQLVSPTLLGYHDGEKAVQTFQRYQQPPQDESDSAGSSLLQSSSN